MAVESDAEGPSEGDALKACIKVAASSIWPGNDFRRELALILLEDPDYRLNMLHLDQILSFRLNHSAASNFHGPQQATPLLRSVLLDPSSSRFFSWISSGRSSHSSGVVYLNVPELLAEAATQPGLCGGGSTSSELFKLLQADILSNGCGLPSSVQLSAPEAPHPSMLLGSKAAATAALGNSLTSSLNLTQAVPSLQPQQQLLLMCTPLDAVTLAALEAAWPQHSTQQEQYLALSTAYILATRSEAPAAAPGGASSGTSGGGGGSSSGSHGLHLADVAALLLQFGAVDAKLAAAAAAAGAAEAAASSRLPGAAAAAAGSGAAAPAGCGSYPNLASFLSQAACCQGLFQLADSTSREGEKVVSLAIDKLMQGAEQDQQQHAAAAAAPLLLHPGPGSGTLPGVPLVAWEAAAAAAAAPQACAPGAVATAAGATSGGSSMDAAADAPDAVAAAACGSSTDSAVLSPSGGGPLPQFLFEFESGVDPALQQQQQQQQQQPNTAAKASVTALPSAMVPTVPSAMVPTWPMDVPAAAGAAAAAASAPAAAVVGSYGSAKTTGSFPDLFARSPLTDHGSLFGTCKVGSFTEVPREVASCWGQSPALPAPGSGSGSAPQTSALAAALNATRGGGGSSLSSSLQHQQQLLAAAAAAAGDVAGAGLLLGGATGSAGGGQQQQQQVQWGWLGASGGGAAGAVGSIGSSSLLQAPLVSAGGAASSWPNASSNNAWSMHALDALLSSHGMAASGGTGTAGGTGGGLMAAAAAAGKPPLHPGQLQQHQQLMGMWGAATAAAAGGAPSSRRTSGNAAAHGGSTGGTSLAAAAAAADAAAESRTPHRSRGPASNSSLMSSSMATTAGVGGLLLHRDSQESGSQHCSPSTADEDQCGGAYDAGSVQHLQDLESALEAIMAFPDAAAAVAAAAALPLPGQQAAASAGAQQQRQLTAVAAAAAHQLQRQQAALGAAAAAAAAAGYGQLQHQHQQLQQSGMKSFAAAARANLKPHAGGDGSGSSRAAGSAAAGASSLHAAAMAAAAGLGLPGLDMSGAGSNYGFPPDDDLLDLQGAFGGAAGAQGSAAGSASAAVGLLQAAAAAAAAAGAGGNGIPRSGAGGQGSGQRVMTGWAAVAAREPAKQQQQQLAAAAAAAAQGLGHRLALNARQQQHIPGSAAAGSAAAAQLRAAQQHQHQLSGGLAASLAAAAAAAAAPGSRSFLKLSSRVREEILRLVTSVPNLKLEDFDDGVLYQLSAKRNEEEAVGALRMLGEADLSGIQHLAAYINHVIKNYHHHHGAGSDVTSPSATVRANSMPVSSKAMLQKLPYQVFKRLEEAVGSCICLEWKHFDAGVVKVMSQLAELSEEDVLEELSLLQSADLTAVEYMPAYLNKRLNNRLWSRRKAQQQVAAALPQR